MTPVLAFDIETIPDVAGIRKLHDLPADLSDGEVAEFAFQKRRAASGSDFLPLHLQRVAVISCALREGARFTVWSLAEPQLTEAAIVQRFYDGIEKFSPQLVSWNGGGFDLPVLHYRGLIHGARAPRYWDQGEDDRDFKWNNYISRYHARHLDLMDLLALYQPRANAPLDELAKLMGLPGKLGMDGSAVWGAWQEGRIDEIRDYCETDAVNTFLVYLHFQRLRGVLSQQACADEMARVRAALEDLKQPHWRRFLDAWEH
ncbi:MAG: 3'-5' exonuclease [Zoogloeaceae bacterium]|jgi:predicted PolB exonuclease-like 3'-5' exonuclease|nr:3'-5' exonuclease [Zoogloeaceae bacterium]